MIMIALVAHDERKTALLEWAEEHRLALKREKVVATGTTARLLRERLGLQVTAVASGPEGGDQQIGALITTGEVSALVFFWDPLWAAPHAADVHALLRIATLHNIPVATNTAGADVMAAVGFPRLDRAA
ncbi:methylglyoxal synthase [Streptomyces sp. NPDC001941]|uniref:methylglyoxal synthase n=1 Tax=Streptomyces sp. NPDC001941 TaxID=3154659 RepID=UPI00332BBEE2